MNPRLIRIAITTLLFCSTAGIVSAEEALPEVFREALSKPDSTTRLDLGKADLKRIPAEIGQLHVLERLKLGPNDQLTAIDPAIGQLTELTHLDIGGAINLHTLPAAVGECRALRFIGGWPTGLARLPDTIGDLSNLEELRLSGHYYGREGQVGLRTLPESIGRLQKLRVLRADHQRIETIPDSLGDCAALEYILLQGSYSEIPASITRLEALRFLGLDTRELRELPAGLIDLPALETLLIKRIERLPEDWSQSRLRYLAIGNRYAKGSLAALPADMVNAPNLQAIDITAQRLQQTPEDLDRLQSLRILDLGYHPLTSVPALPAGLMIAMFEHGQLAQAPAALADCPELQVLNLAGNPLQALDLPWEQLGQLKVLVLDEEWHDQVPRDQLPELQHLWTGEECRKQFTKWFGEALPELRQRSGGTGVRYR